MGMGFSKTIIINGFMCENLLFLACISVRSRHAFCVCLCDAGDVLSCDDDLLRQWWVRRCWWQRHFRNFRERIQRCPYRIPIIFQKHNIRIVCTCDRMSEVLELKSALSKGQHDKALSVKFEDDHENQVEMKRKYQGEDHGDLSDREWFMARGKLFRSARLGLNKVVDEMQKKMFVDVRDPNMNTVLIVAASQNNKRMVKHCLRLGADIDAQNVRN